MQHNPRSSATARAERRLTRSSDNCNVSAFPDNGAYDSIINVRNEEWNKYAGSGSCAYSSGSFSPRRARRGGRRLRARSGRGEERLQRAITGAAQCTRFARPSASPHTGFLLAVYPFFVRHAFTHDGSVCATPSSEESLSSRHYGMSLSREGSFFKRVQLHSLHTICVKWFFESPYKPS